MANVETGQGGLLTPWTAGEPLDHRKLNQSVKALQALTKGVRPPSQIVPKAGEAAVVSIQQFKIESIAGDYLVCNPWNGIEATASQFLIAKPPELRRSRVSWNGLTFTYVDDQSRVADDGSETEDQVVVPLYVVGDVIYGLKGITGGTGVELEDGSAVDWLDQNVAGRAWAKDDA